MFKAGLALRRGIRKGFEAVLKCVVILTLFVEPQAVLATHSHNAFC